MVQRQWMQGTLVALCASLCGFLLSHGMLGASNSSNSLAQAPANGSRSHVPQSSPGLSPYLNLTQPNSGALPSYHAFVQPLLEQQRFNERQTIAINRLQSNANQAPRSSSPQATRPTGHNGRFMEYSHFYPAPQKR